MVHIIPHSEFRIPNYPDKSRFIRIPLRCLTGREIIKEQAS